MLSHITQCNSDFINGSIANSTSIHLKIYKGHLVSFQNTFLLAFHCALSKTLGLLFTCPCLLPSLFHFVGSISLGTFEMTEDMKGIPAYRGSEIQFRVNEPSSVLSLTGEPR